MRDWPSKTFLKTSMLRCQRRLRKKTKAYWTTCQYLTMMRLRNCTNSSRNTWYRSARIFLFNIMRFWETLLFVLHYTEHRGEEAARMVITEYEDAIKSVVQWYRARNSIFFAGGPIGPPLFKTWGPKHVYFYVWGSKSLGPLGPRPQKRGAMK